MTSNNEISAVGELNEAETDVVSGGNPALILPFAVGFALGFMGEMAFGSVGPQPNAWQQIKGQIPK